MDISTKRLDISIFEKNDLKELVKSMIIDSIFLDDMNNFLEEQIDIDMKYCTYNRVYLDKKEIGCIYYKDYNEGTIQIYYKILNEYQNNGYATEAVKASIEQAFKNPHVDTICAYILDNPSAVRVLAKNKFHFIKETNEGNYYELLK